MTVFQRAGVASIVLAGIVLQQAYAQQAPSADPPRVRSIMPAPPPPPDVLNPTPAAPRTSPASPGPGAAPATTPASAVAPAAPVPASVAVPSASAASAAATPSASPTLPQASPPPAAERKAPSLDIDIPANIVGPTLDSLRRNLGTGAGQGYGALKISGLKRLSREEIQAATGEGLSIYVLRDNERTLVLDFPNIREQARMFARLILFVERAGAPKTRVLTVPEVQKWLVQNSVQFDTLTVGNNMRTGELARFFNSARFQGEPITVDEQRLYDWLVQSQLLREEEAGVAVVDPERILVSLPQASSVPGCAGCSVTAAQRGVILQHELSHARFATDTVYQNYVLWFWSNSMSLVTRDKFTRFLRTRGYDSTIRELCANEMQAFLMNTPDPAMFSATDLGVTDAELADLRRRFQEGISPRPRASADKPYQFD